jgi:energy-coupling factor transporter transmembrane protein EcfT
VLADELHDEHWRDSHPGLGPALETMTSAGTPLLAGFCVTMIGVVAQAPDKFWWSSMTMLLLTFAAIAFVISIHCYYWARVHLIESGGAESRGLPPSAKLNHHREHFAHLAWARRLHVFFQVGVLGLFVGLATAVWPTSAGTDAWPRAIAVVACRAMVLGCCSGPLAALRH